MTNAIGTTQNSVSICDVTDVSVSFSVDRTAFLGGDASLAVELLTTALADLDEGEVRIRVRVGVVRVG